jgi:D-arabinose 5-phosphate isomerase GutQ
VSHNFDETLRVLTSAIRSLDPREFAALEEDAIATLERGNKLVFSGLGKNVPVCEKVVGTLNSVGLAAAFVHTNSAVHGDLGVVHDGDLVVILTKSGETSESVHLSKLLERRDCTQWLLTFNRDSILFRDIARSVVIDMEHEGDSWNILPNNSTVLNLVVLQGLCMTLIEYFAVPIDVLHANHPGGAIGAKLDAAELHAELDDPDLAAAALDAARLDGIAAELEAAHLNGRRRGRQSFLQVKPRR